MSKKNSAIALMALLSVSVTFTLIAGAASQAANETALPKRTPADVSTIIAQQQATLEADTKLHKESKTYPFFSRYQSPGMRTITDVELRTVLEGSLANEKPEDYNTRVVTFAPRKGVDFIDIDPRMPLREWTFTAEGLRNNVIPAMFQNADRTLKAHLVGFRGIGYTINEGEFKGEIDIPCVLLRLPDGRIRMIETKYLSKEDLQFAAKHHKAAFDDIKANRIPEQPRVIPQNVKNKCPKPTEPGVKNSHFLTESQFVVFMSGSEHPEPGNAKHWVTWINAMGDKKAGRKVRTETSAWFDAHWLIFEYSGFHMPGINSPEPRSKFGWFVGGPTIDGKGTKGGGGGWHIGNGSPGIGAHEFGHMTLFLNGVRHGGGESWTDSLRDTAFATGTGGNELNTPHQHLFLSGNRYAFTYFYNIVGEDPSLGYLWYARLPVYKDQASANSAMHLIAELFKRQKLTEYAKRSMVNKPVEEFGDLFGEYAARTATFDNQKESLYHNSRYSPPRHVLELVDREANIWRIPADLAPYAQGFNVIRLVPEKGAKNIAVDFTGLHDPSIYSDWRVCIIAVEADGKRRYSNLWNKGPVKFPVKADDRSIWLTVAATPTALKETNGLTPGGHFLKRLPTYPWSVKLSQATVGTPARLAEEFGPKITGAGSVDLSQLVPHKNGGGLVANTATVADTAYVGPNAMVLDNAKVLDHASIEGFAIVKGNAVVKDNAKLYGNAEAKGNTVVGGYSRYHVPVVTGIKSDLMANNPLIPRFGKATLRDDGLWANYAMMDTDRNKLHDYYRYAEASLSGNLPAYPNLNGYVFGEPAAVAYDDGSDEHAAGLRFNGKDQYATLHSAVMDIPEATIVTKLIVEPGVAGTVFDFGADKGNCMTLTIAADGTLKLKATVKGKSVVSLTGSKKIARARLVSLRVTVDGKTAALWMDEDKIAEVKANFRSCDVFPPDAIRQNLIASSRDGKNRLKALFDSVAIYAKVHGELDAKPVLDAPPIVGDNVFKLLSQRLDPERQKKLMASASNIDNFYKLGSSGEPNFYLNRDNARNYKELYTKNILGKRWYQLSRRDETYVKWVDEILPAMEAEKNTPEGKTEAAKKRHTELAREFREKIEPAAYRNFPEEAKAIESMINGLYRYHWNLSYFRYLKDTYYPNLLGSQREDLKLLTAQNILSKEPKGWVKSSDITAPLPRDKDGVVWSKEGILSGKYDKLQETAKQWYLHTHGPIAK
ncbi:DUF6055 domain-containing protein [Candidatus Sumerlaeota bacterium]